MNPTQYWWGMVLSAVAFGAVALASFKVAGLLPAALMMLALVSYFVFAAKWIVPEKPLPGERLLRRSGE